MRANPVIPLTTEEKAFANKHHNLIYGFLDQYKYSYDEFYDIAVFGFLSAVQSYFKNEKLKKYSFTTVAYCNMKGEISHYFLGKSRKKNTAQLISVDKGFSDSEDCTYLNLISCGENDFENIETKLCVESLLSLCTESQRITLKLMLKGYTYDEIAKMRSISNQAVTLQRASGIAKIRKTLAPTAIGVSA